MYVASIVLPALTFGGSLVNVVPVELVKRADLRGFDISSAESKGYVKAVIRGYQ